MTGMGKYEFGNPDTYYPDTQVLIDALFQDPTLPFECSHGGEPAIGVYEVPTGCVALPGLETQTLCPQHVITNGSFAGMRLVVDLSVDAAWSIHRGEIPDYCIVGDPASGEFAMVRFLSSSFADAIPVK